MELLETTFPVVDFDTTAGTCYRRTDLHHLFFVMPKTVEGRAQQNRAKAMCRSCPIKQPCLTYALSHPQIDGVWGGTSLPDRQAIRSARLAEKRAQAAARAQEVA